MLQLPNGCRCSNPSVFPKNWKTAGASIKKDWRIQFYFYDPVKKPKGKLFIVKGGINKFKTVTERRTAVNLAMPELLHQLTVEGYNPITGEAIVLPASSEIELTTGLIAALRHVFNKVVVVDGTRTDMRSMLKYFELGADKLGYSCMAINEVRRRHIKLILDQVGRTRKLSSHRFNKYRTYLSILFAELLELEVVESNYIKDIKIQKTVKTIREVPTDEQRRLINDELHKKHYHFWRFLQIFFHSGGRITELLSLQDVAIDLKKQRYKTKILKGKNQKEVWRPIKNIILPLWKEVMEETTPGFYLFGPGLIPAALTKPIRTEQITRRWRTHVKKKLNVTADFYSLKHLNLDETAEQLDIMAAAAMAGHTTPVVTMDYAIGEKKRQDDRLKQVKNSFAG